MAHTNSKIKIYSHKQYSEQVARPASHCAAWHITFGGRCLNCGFDPEMLKAKAFAGHTRGGLDFEDLGVIE